MNPNQERDLKIVQLAVNQLMEHFDTVQVFTTRHPTGPETGTVNIAMGEGNWFARYGQVREWLVKEEEDSRARITRHVEM